MEETVLNNLIDELKQDEGFRQHPYRCTAGKLTIGYGRNLDDVGISRAEADYLLIHDVLKCSEDLYKIFDDFENFPVQVQTVLLNMRFQLGAGGFRKFRKFIQACKLHAWKIAIKEMKDSLWYRQTTNRADRLIAKMERI